MKKIYADYFQKSKVFLYPLIGIKKGVRFVPIETYIEWDQLNNPNTLYCLYIVPKKEQDKKVFQVFIEMHVKNREFFDQYFYLNNDKYILCSFDLSLFKKDLKKFRNGKYSEFSEYTKNIIIKFFGNKGTISEYIESYLYPEYYHETYSKILNIDVNVLKEVNELCDIPDIARETFVKESIEIKLFK